MDPVTAFSLACGVIQVVDFSLRILSKTKEIQERGSLDENDRLEYLASRLKDLKVNSHIPPNSGGSSQTRSQDQQVLQELADECSKTVQILVAELAKLKVTDSKRKFQVVKVTLRTILKRSTLKELEEKLNCYRDLLNTRILVGLR